MRFIERTGIILVRQILLTSLVGCIAGAFDILPMIKMKLDKYAISSAFTFYFVMPFVIYNLRLLENPWWLKGGIITPVLELPIMILASKSDKKAVLPMTVMAVILGTCIGIAGYYLGLF